MTEVLAPYTDFADEDLANSLHDIAQRNRDYLRRRGYYGWLHRYGGALALEKVQKGKREDSETGIPSHFAIVQTVAEGATYRKEVVGTASIQRGLPLYRLPDLGIFTPPPAVAEKLGLREQVEDPRLTHNIGVVIDNDKALSGNIKGHRVDLAYQLLVGKVSEEDTGAHAWMLIPEGQQHQHEQYYAAEAGLGSIAIARFDDLESRWHVPPVSELYLSSQ